MVAASRSSDGHGVVTDPYEAMAEFHDLFMAGPWARLQPHLAGAFGGLTSDDVVVDVGAGSGVGTRALARSTSAQVVAIEPSLTMRTVLLARMADDDDLARRVSVVAGRVPDVLDEVLVPLDDGRGVIAGFVCAHMFGHLSSADRIATLTRLADALAPTGTGVITHAPHAPTDAEVEPFEEATVLGRHRYVARYEDSGDDHVSQVIYSVREGDRVLRSVTAIATWAPPTTAELDDELTRSGLRTVDQDQGLVLVRRQEQSR